MILLIIVIILLIIAGYAVINLLYKKTNAYKNEQIPYSKYFTTIPDGLKLAVFGSTYALYAFDGYKNLRLNAFNFALPSQSLEIDSVLLHKYAKYIAPDSVVIFCLAACVTYFRYDMVSDKTNYYSFLSRKEIPSYSISDIIKSVFPLYGKKLKKAKRILLDVAEKSDIYEKATAFLSKEEAENNMKGMADCWIRLFNLQNLKNADQNDTNSYNQNVNTSLLKSMFLFCHEMSWHPVVVIPPFSSELNQFFGDDFINSSLYGMIKDAKEGMDVPLLDYRNDKSFQQQYSLFIDGGFRLSKYGSIKLIRMVLDDLTLLGYNLTNKVIGR